MPSGPYSRIGVTVRGGMLGNRAIDASQLTRLATLPSREVLLGKIAGGMAAPLTGMAGVLAANLRNFVDVLNAVADKKRADRDRGLSAAATNQTGEPIPMATKTLDKDQILEAIDTMTVLELSELVKAFEERYGVTAAAPVAVAAGAPARWRWRQLPPRPRSRPSSTRCSPRSARTRSS